MLKAENIRSARCSRVVPLNSSLLAKQIFYLCSCSHARECSQRPFVTPASAEQGRENYPEQVTLFVSYRCPRNFNGSDSTLNNVDFIIAVYMFTSVLMAWLMDQSMELQAKR